MFIIEYSQSEIRYHCTLEKQYNFYGDINVFDTRNLTSMNALKYFTYSVRTPDLL